jgi:hypothetical protein
MDTVAKLQSRLMNRTGLDQTVIPPIECEDGFGVSVQASPYHYCSPRSNCGPWFTVECGFPTHPMPELAEYCQSGGDALTDTKTVWAEVPIEAIAAVLDSHGGIKE